MANKRETGRAWPVISYCTVELWLMYPYGVSNVLMGEPVLVCKPVLSLATLSLLLPDVSVSFFCLLLRRKICISTKTCVIEQGTA
jgi:hypothetical protein